ncbi:MAG: hypothetical protein HYX71_12485 [Opitutae bacterium]|nr:hypothetical protein [Opitutae bacterium]
MQVDVGFVSRHVFRGVERAGASAQAAVAIKRDNFHGGVWANLPFNKGETRELKLHAACTWQPMEALKLEASVAQRWFSDVPGGGVGRSLEAGLAATLPPVNGFTPGLAYYHDFTFRADTTQVSLARSIALVKWGAFLELNFHAGWAAGDDWRPDAPGPRLRDSYGYWGGEARLPYRIGAHATVTVGLHYADAFGRSDANGPFGLSARQNLWFTLGVNLDF